MAVEFVGKYDGIELYRLSCAAAYVEIINYGARIHKICVPDKNGETKDVVLGYVEPNGYVGDGAYLNAVVGRVANRIGGAKFVIDGVEYKLNANEGKNQLHGGFQGFDSKIFESEIDGDILRLSYLSPDGEEGYPGNCKVVVEYSFAGNRLKISYKATSDKKTHCSLTNHAYFNLNGDYESIENHLLKISSHAVTDIDEELIPNGKIVDISGSALDFSNEKTIGRDINQSNRLFDIAGGYDFNYILDEGVSPVAVATGDKSGIEMKIYTDRPCMQFYSGNFLDGTIKGKAVFGKRSAFALETQGYPNACNIPSFPSTIIDKNAFESVTIYEFGVRK